MFSEVMSGGETVLSGNGRAIVVNGDTVYFVDVEDEEVLNWKEGRVGIKIAGKGEFHPSEPGFGDVFHSDVVGELNESDGLSFEYRLGEDHIDIKADIGDAHEQTKKALKRNSNLDIRFKFEDLNEFQGAKQYKKEIVSRRLTD